MLKPVPVRCFLICGIRSFCDEVRVRFAPSPTGNLHLGGLRTALYNYLFARAKKGKFILRIEDTDQRRSVIGSIEQIETTLDRYKLHRDEGPSCGGKYGPYVQSERLSKYIDAVEQLIESGHAYRCFCSETRLEMFRREAARRNEVPKYDNHCRTLNEDEIKRKLDSGTSYTVRFKLENKDIAFKDIVYGDIVQNPDEGDFIILKSDSFPTYHLANVVDDHLMKISHVIRGCEWLPSVAKHVQLYKAFGWKPPSWAHLPLIVRSSKKKLSKRDKDAYVGYYDLEKGYLPKAVLNFLVRNGSGIQNFDPQHLYSLDEMIEQFDISLIGKRNLMLDQLYLDIYGHKALQEADVEKELIPEISRRLKIILETSDVQVVTDSDYIKRLLKLFNRTEQKFAYLKELTDGDFKFYIMRPETPESLLKKCESDLAVRVLQDLLNAEDWSLDNLKAIATAHNIKQPLMFMIIRVTLIGSSNGPPVKELLGFFGRNECERRFTDMITMLQKQPVRGTVP